MGMAGAESRCTITTSYVTLLWFCNNIFLGACEQINIIAKSGWELAGKGQRQRSDYYRLLLVEI